MTARPLRLTMHAPLEPSPSEILADQAKRIAERDGIGQAILALRQVQIDLAQAWRDEGRQMAGWII